MLTKENKQKMFLQKRDDNGENEQNKKMVESNIGSSVDKTDLERAEDEVVGERLNSVGSRRSFICPKQHDTLFWCLYIIFHGYNDYNEITHNSGVKELEEKRRIYDFVKDNIYKLKNTNYKVTNILTQEIMSELITVQKETSMNVLLAMIVFYNINIFIVDKDEKCMLEFWSNKENVENINSDDEDSRALTYVLFKDNFGKYKLQIENISPTRIEGMRNTYISIDNYNKPMKSMTAFKLEELEAFARKIKIYDETKKYKKSELYEMINKECTWTI